MRRSFILLPRFVRWVVVSCPPAANSWSDREAQKGCHKSRSVSNTLVLMIMTFPPNFLFMCFKIVLMSLTTFAYSLLLMGYFHAAFSRPGHGRRRLPAVTLETRYIGHNPMRRRSIHGSIGTTTEKKRVSRYKS